MSKSIIFSFLMSLTLFSQASKASGKSDFTDDELKVAINESGVSKIDKIYPQCDESKPKNLSEVQELKKAGSNEKTRTRDGVERYAECNLNMSRIENFTGKDSQIVVDPESYANELELIIKEDHLNGLVQKYKSNIKSKIKEILNQSLSCSFVDSYRATIQGYSEAYSASGVAAAILMFELQSIDKFKEECNVYSQSNKAGTEPRMKKIFDGSQGGFIALEEMDLESLKEKFVMNGTDTLEEGREVNDHISLKSEAYSGQLAYVIISKLCKDKKLEDCKKDLIDESIDNLLSRSALDFPNPNGSETVNIVALESFNMVGHFEALRKLEKYIAIEREQGIFDSRGERYRGGQTESYCLRPTRYTVDFKACQGVVGAQNIKAVADMAKTTIGGAADQLHQQSIQKEYQRNIDSGMTNAEAALAAQKRTYTGQENIATTASAAYGGSAASLSTMLATYPSEGLFSRRCKNGERREIDYCYILQNSKGLNLFANKQIKNEAWGMVGQLTGDALKHAMEAIHFNDMAKQTEGMENDLNGALEEIATIGFDSCLNNSELCNNQTATGETTTLGMGDFSIGSNGFDTQAFVQPTESTGDIDTSSGISKTEAQQLGDSLRDGGSSLSDSFNKISAGELGGRSGGSGGGGGGGGSAGGGGGSSGGGASAQAGTESAGASGVPKIGSSYTRGRNIASKRGKSATKKSSSPYSNLFNKSKTNRNIASEINDIADKESGLFKKISKRYETLKSKNRLK